MNTAPRLNAEVPAAVVEAALAAYYGPPSGKASLEAAVQVAYRAGMEALLGRTEWRVTFVSSASKARVLWSNSTSEAVARADLATAIEEGTWTDPRIETRRVGHTAWEPAK